MATLSRKLYCHSLFISLFPLLPLLFFVFLVYFYKLNNWHYSFSVGPDAGRLTEVILLSQWAAAQLSGTEIFKDALFISPNICGVFLKFSFFLFLCVVDRGGDVPE